jgi:hypothetical protein
LGSSEAGQASKRKARLENISPLAINRLSQMLQGANSQHLLTPYKKKNSIIFNCI